MMDCHLRTLAFCSAEIQKVPHCFTSLNMSLPFDHTCCLDKSDRKNKVEGHDRSRSLFPLPKVQFDVVHQHLDLRHRQHTNSYEFSCSCFSLFVGFFGFILTLGVSASKRSPSSSFPISTSARDSPTGSMSSPMVLHLDSEVSLDLRAHCSAIPVS